MRSLSAHALLTILVSIAAFFSVMGKDLPIDLGLARHYAVLAGSTVTSTGVVGTVVMGDVGVFPGTAITGFPPGVLGGALDSANGASASAQGALAVAYNIAAAKPLTQTLTDVDMGGLTLLPGVYKFDVESNLNGKLTLDAKGNSAAVWTFQIGTTLMLGEGSSVVFKNGVGNPDNVVWQVGTSATLGSGSKLIGNVLAYASITLGGGTSVKGRCLARSAAVTLDMSVVTMPAKAK